MSSSRSPVLMLLPLLGAVLLIGCSSPAPKPVAPPPIVAATPDQEADLQAQLTKAYPGASVGHVSAVNTAAGTAAILGIPLGAVHRGDSVQFQDSKLNPIANGTVVDENTDNPNYSFLIVQFEPTASGRAPVKDDLAVYLPRKMSGRDCAADNIMETPRLILASASPRRRELLREAGYDFEVHPAEIDEDDYPPQTLPADLAQRLAMLKAEALVGRFPTDVIIAADTVVAFGDTPLGKPENEAAATEMLDLLSGTTHVVITGVTVIRPATKFRISTRVMSAVRMRAWSAKEIERYVASGDWQGKAGGYGIQDNRSDPFVIRMAGSHTNIVGLPMEATAELLASAGVFPAAAQVTSNEQK